MIPVTKTFFPPLEEYNKYLEKIWQNGWLTNRGELVDTLEKKLRDFLGLSEKNKFFLTANGTLSLQLALHSLPEKGEIITTPFTYVATVSSIVWEGFTPVFVDIDPETLTMDPVKIESAITEKTKAILPVHVYGNPADVVRIDQIGKKYGIPVIYDAAHAFGVQFEERSVLEYGDISIISFHATKLFQTAEGGAVFTKNNKLFDKLFQMHNFGHLSPVSFGEVGINAKMSELHAAMGLAVLPYMNHIIESRKKVAELYDQYLDWTKLSKPKSRKGTSWNYAYYPVIFPDEEYLLRVVKKLNEKQIFPRRYFYPSLNKLPYLQYQKVPVSENIAPRVLCLPMYENLDKKSIIKICNIFEE